MQRSRFDYVKYDQQAQKDSEDAKLLAVTFEQFITERISAGRAQSLALTKLEECFMWIGKGIRDDLVKRDEATQLQESRG